MVKWFYWFNESAKPRSVVCKSSARHCDSSKTAAVYVPVRSWVILCVNLFFYSVFPKRESVMKNVETKNVGWRFLFVFHSWVFFNSIFIDIIWRKLEVCYTFQFSSHDILNRKIPNITWYKKLLGEQSQICKDKYYQIQTIFESCLLFCQWNFFQTNSVFGWC